MTVIREMFSLVDDRAQKLLCYKTQEWLDEHPVHITSCLAACSSHEEGQSCQKSLKAPSAALVVYDLESSSCSTAAELAHLGDFDQPLESGLYQKVFWHYLNSRRHGSRN